MAGDSRHEHKGGVICCADFAIKVTLENLYFSLSDKSNIR